MRRRAGCQAHARLPAAETDLAQGTTHHRPCDAHLAPAGRDLRKTQAPPAAGRAPAADQTRLSQAKQQPDATWREPRLNPLPGAARAHSSSRTRLHASQAAGAGCVGGLRTARANPRADACDAGRRRHIAANAAPGRTLAAPAVTSHGQEQRTPSPAPGRRQVLATVGGDFAQPGATHRPAAGPATARCLQRSELTSHSQEQHAAQPPAQPPSGACNGRS